MDFDAYALGKPGAWPDEPWEGDRVAKVADKIFCFLPGDGGTTIGLKCGTSREEADEWLARYPDGVAVMAYIGRHGWNTITLDGVPAEEIREAIDYSYDLVIAKLPKSKRP